MVSICLDLKEEVQWEDLSLLLTKMKKEQFLQEHQTRVNYLFVIGLLDQQTKLEVKTIL